MKNSVDLRDQYVLRALFCINSSVHIGHWHAIRRNGCSHPGSLRATRLVLCEVSKCILRVLRAGPGMYLSFKRVGIAEMLQDAGVDPSDGLELEEGC